MHSTRRKALTVNYVMKPQHILKVTRPKRFLTKSESHAVIRHAISERFACMIILVGITLRQASSRVGADDDRFFQRPGLVGFKH